MGKNGFFGEKQWEGKRGFFGLKWEEFWISQILKIKIVQIEQTKKKNLKISENPVENGVRMVKNGKNGIWGGKGGFWGLQKLGNGLDPEKAPKPPKMKKKIAKN